MKPATRTIEKVYEQGDIWWKIRDEDGLEFGTVATLDEAIAFGVEIGHSQAFRLIENDEPRFLIRDGSGRGFCNEVRYMQFTAEDRDYMEETYDVDGEQEENQTFGEWLDSSYAGDEFDNSDSMFTVTRIN